MGRLQGVTVDIEGASALAYFEVIEIVDDSNPYLVLLRIVWATDMNGVINLKKRKMIAPCSGATGSHRRTALYRTSPQL